MNTKSVQPEPADASASGLIEARQEVLDRTVILRRFLALAPLLSPTGALVPKRQAHQAG